MVAPTDRFDFADRFCPMTGTSPVTTELRKGCEQSRFGYGFAQTPLFPLLGGRNKTEPYKIYQKTILKKRVPY